MYRVMFFLENIFLQTLIMLRGSMDLIMVAQSTHFIISENSACTQGEHDPLPLMSKGESDLVLLLPSSPKGEIVSIMKKVLSLMATHSDEISQYNKLIAKNCRSYYTE